MDYSKLTLEELFEATREAIKGVFKDIFNKEYSGIECEEKKQILTYMAYDRTCMYLATNVLNTTFYQFSLRKLKQDKNRKALKKIIGACEDLSYSTIREEWHNSLKKRFYQQKEAKKKSEKLDSLCVIVRNESQNAFVRLINGNPELTNSISEATEFSIEDNTNEELKSIESKLVNSNLYTTDIFNAFFNQKMKGRVHSSYS